MSPFQKNLQKFLIFFFTALSALIIFVGINRAKKVPSISEAPSPTPTPDGATAPLAGTGTPAGTTATNTGAIVAYTGKTYQTPYGYVSAAIKVKDGKVVAVSMPQIPNSPPSQYAEPYLIDQALKAGSANIQGVSGATYTSLAFKSSLESAIAQAQAKGQKVTAAPAGAVSSTPTPAPSVPRSYREDD